jgi:hypothetical protein
VALIFNELARAEEGARIGPPTKPLASELVQACEQTFALADELCVTAGLWHAQPEVKRLRLEFAAGIKNGAAAQALAGLNIALLRELDERALFVVPAGHAGLYRNERMLGDAVFEAFPSAREDIAEAGSCYATGCYTAAVFHGMRVLEHGLRAMATDLGRTYDTQSWGGILDEIETEIGRVRKNGIPGLSKAEKDHKLGFWSEAAKEFGYFKDGWRNHVSHGRTFYDEHSALGVLRHVGTFMAVLARHLKE